MAKKPAATSTSSEESATVAPIADTDPGTEGQPIFRKRMERAGFNFTIDHAPDQEQAIARAEDEFSGNNHNRRVAMRQALIGDGLRDPRATREKMQPVDEKEARRLADTSTADVFVGVMPGEFPSLLTPPSSLTEPERVKKADTVAGGGGNGSGAGSGGWTANPGA